MKPHRRWWIPCGLAAVLVASGAGWVVTHPKAAPPSNPYHLPSLPSGRLAPGFSLPRLGGGASVRFASGSDEPLVINFFASWCPNCAGELTTFAAEARSTRGKVAFVGIDSNDSDRSAVTAMTSRADVGYPVAVDTSAGTAVAYRVVGLPTTVFVDRRGRVFGEAFGAQSSKTLRAWVDRLERS